MSSKLLVAAVAVTVLGSVGCSGIFVAKERYEKDVDHLKAENDALRRDNAENHKYKDAFERHAAECQISVTTSKAYEDMAESLKKALEGLKIDPIDAPFVDKRTGAIVLTESLLFDLGSFTVSARGKDVLKKLADANRRSTFRIVGHTDSTPIARKETKDKLFSDTNMELSALRAVAVMQEIKRSGIPEDHMWVEGRGSAEPRGDKKSSRRVEIFLAGGDTKTSNR